jgi:hypothetical protein
MIATLDIIKDVLKPFFDWLFETAKWLDMTPLTLLLILALMLGIFSGMMQTLAKRKHDRKNRLP